MSKLKKRFLIFGITILVIGGVLLIWMKQDATVTETDVQKGQEVAEDDELLNAIDNGINTTTADTNTVSIDSL